MSGMLHDSQARLCRMVGTLWLAVLLASADQALARVTWQLTFSYDAQKVSLVGAAPLANPSRHAESFAAFGSPVNLAFILEWCEAGGNVVLRVPVAIPLGLRSALGDGMVTLSHQTPIPSNGAFVLRVPGPENLTMARSVRLLRNWTADSVGAGMVAAVPVAFFANEQVFALPECVPVQSLPRSLGGVAGGRKIQDTGPDANRLVIVVMGDGFTAADLAAGKFSIQVSRFLDRFFATSPWDVYRNAVNVYQVDLTSNESGADYEDAAPANGGTLKDTYLDSQFWSGGVERLLYLNGTGITRAFAAADSIVGVGDWDKILVFVNSTKYGGCGGAVGVSSLHPNSDEIQIHEFGHSFAGLADEYDYGLDSTNCVETPLPNVDCGLHLPNVKWSAWVKPGTPLPTPPTVDFANVVGAFEGGLYQARGVYRPMLDCKMRTLGAPFCPVCQEAHVLKLFDRMDPAGLATPAAATVEITSQLARQFSVDPIRLGGLSYRWFLDGVELSGETNSSVTLANDGSRSPTGVLEVIATHASPFVRAKPIQSRHAWNLVFTDAPSILMGDIAFLERDAGTNETVVTVTLSSPSSGTITADFATQDGTATLNEDYLANAGRIVFQPGETTQTVALRILGDIQPESDEVFSVRLSNAVSAKLPQSQMLVSIFDDDSPPSVALLSPAAGDVFLEGQAIPISVNAAQPHGQIARVDVFSGELALISLTNTPYTADWAAPPGIHTLSAVAMDGAGRTTTSAPVRLTVLATGQQRLPLLALTNAWRFDATTNDYGRAWMTPTFDDSGWRGPSNAVFYSANFPVAGTKQTAFALTSNGTRIRSVYFRTHFQFTGIPSPAVTLVASNVVDDGAVFYLNGQEAGRLRMPAGEITRTSFALPGGWATNFDAVHLDSSGLVEGDNVLAVELHLASDTSFPASFGMSLEARINPTSVLERLASGGVKQRVSRLLEKDPAGAAAVLVSAGPASVQGGAVQTNGNWLFYSPPPGYTNLDSFTFATSDGVGVNLRTALVAVRSDNAATRNLNVVMLSSGEALIRGDGIPSQAYVLESSDSVGSLSWQRVTTVVADTMGRWEFLHQPGTGAPPAVYRTVEP